MSRISQIGPRVPQRFKDWKKLSWRHEMAGFRCEDEQTHWANHPEVVMWLRSSPSVKARKRETMRRYCARNSDYISKRMRQDRETLSDSYVRKLLLASTNPPKPEEITAAMIQEKQAALVLWRKHSAFLRTPDGRQKQIDTERSTRRRWLARHVAKLNDGYVRDLLRQGSVRLKANDFPSALVEIKRLQVIAKREATKLKV